MGSHPFQWIQVFNPCVSLEGVVLFQKALNLKIKAIFMDPESKLMVLDVMVVPSDWWLPML